jgi:hypothetical protein
MLIFVSTVMSSFFRIVVRSLEVIDQCTPRPFLNGRQVCFLQSEFSSDMPLIVPRLWLPLLSHQNLHV